MIIIDMEMPKSCTTCPIVNYIETHDDSGYIDLYNGFFDCDILGSCEDLSSFDNTRHPKCPLKEVPNDQFSRK